MNEKLQYATMLEIPVNTCSVTVKSGKARKRKSKKKVNSEEVKNKLITKINSTEQESAVFMPTEEQADQTIVPVEMQEEVEQTSIIEKPKKKKPFFSVIGAQIAVIGVLISAIFLTNAFYPESGLNVFFNQVFSSEQMESVDQRTYKDFLPVFAAAETELTLGDGVITFGENSSVYSPCDGTVVSVTQGEDGKFTMVVEHSKNFSTTVSGLDFAYCSVGDSVLKNVPVGFARGEGASMCFLGSDGAVISGYTLEGNSVIWAV